MIEFNFQKSRFYVFSKKQVEEMFEVTPPSSSPAYDFKKAAEEILVELGKILSKESTADKKQVVISWPKSGSVEGVIMEIEEKWKAKKVEYLEALRAR